MFKLDKRAFAFYSEAAHDWLVEEGDFIISVGSSSRDIRLTDEVFVSSKDRIPVKYTVNSPLGDIAADPNSRKIFGNMFEEISKGMREAQPEDSMGAATELMTNAMLREMPIRAILSFSGEAFITYDELGKMIDELNRMNNY
jgi:beta-glucosidase